MGKAWVKRWSPEKKGVKGSFVEILEVKPMPSIEEIQWRLPPSKSHAIRLLAIAGQSNQSILLKGMEHAGDDVVAMRRCLRQMGVSCADVGTDGEVLPPNPNLDDQPPEGTVAWRIEGVGPHGLHPPVSVLHAGNSGTTLRILMALASRFSVPIMLDGDASLRSRKYPVMLDSLEKMAVVCSHGTAGEGLPLLIQGPAMHPASLELEATISSQPFTAWHLATPSFSSGRRGLRAGEPVSRRHLALTRGLCVQAGAASSVHDSMLEPWVPTFEHPEITVPSDCSMFAFACLAASVCKTNVKVSNMPSDGDSLGHEVLFTYAASLGLVLNNGLIEPNAPSSSLVADLRDANDLITPLAAMLALGGGGEITGVAHAAHKETNRLTGTKHFLQQFGLDVHLSEGTLHVEGGQTLVSPKELVQTYGDHRMQMTAIVLSMGCSDTVRIEGSRLHRVADPMAVNRWRSQGVSIEEVLHQHW